MLGLDSLLMMEPKLEDAKDDGVGKLARERGERLGLGFESWSGLKGEVRRENLGGFRSAREGGNNLFFGE